MNTQRVSVRELQHNLSAYLDKVSLKPVTVTKHGKVKALLIDPDKYTVTPKKTKEVEKKNLLDSPVVGMYQHREDWKGKTTAQIAQELREKAWYGE